MDTKVMHQPGVSVLRPVFGSDLLLSAAANKIQHALSGEAH